MEIKNKGWEWEWEEAGAVRLVTTKNARIEHRLTGVTLLEKHLRLKNALDSEEVIEIVVSIYFISIILHDNNYNVIPEMGSRYESGFNPRDRPPGSSFGPRRDAPPSYGRDRDGPPSYGRDRDGPSSFGRDRDYGRDRDGQPSYGRDRDGPSYGRDREGPSSFGRDRDGPYGRDREGPSFGRDRDGAYGRDREAPFSRSERPAERGIILNT